MEIKKCLLILLLCGMLLLVGCVNETDLSSIDQIESQEDISEEEQTVSMNDSVEKEEAPQGETLAEENIFEEVAIVESNVSLEKTEWWKPKPNTSWQWQLKGTLNTKYNVDMYDIDLFDNSKEAIKSLQNKGIKVICYFSAGSYENWRIDKDDFPNEVLGNTLEGWEDEKWLDISKIDLLVPIMEARLDLAVEKGCNGVEPDNVDGYLNDNGFSLTSQDQLNYNKWFAEEAHKRGLTVGLKNDLDQIPELVNYFDFALNEQCFEYDECETLLPFIEKGKAVFGVEYDLQPAEFCSKANDFNFDWLRMEYDLDGGRIACR
jgi:hypothetical protein